MLVTEKIRPSVEGETCSDVGVIARVIHSDSLSVTSHSQRLCQKESWPARAGTMKDNHCPGSPIAEAVVFGRPMSRCIAFPDGFHERQMLQH